MTIIDNQFLGAFYSERARFFKSKRMRIQWQRAAAFHYLQARQLMGIE